MRRFLPSSPGLRSLAAAIAFSLAASGPLHSLAQTKAAAPPAAKPPAAKPPAGKAASTASAGAEPPDLIDGSEELQKLYLDGDAALKREAFDEAERLFTKAWAQSRSFDVAAKLGEAKLNLGKHRDAAQYLAFAIRNALPSTRPKRRELIKNLFDEAKAKLASVKLSASVVEAQISIDGAPLDPIFLGPEIYVDPGKRTFEAYAPGFEPARSEIDTKAGEIYVVALTLQRPAPKTVPTAPPPPQGTPWPAAAMGGAGGVAVIVGAVLIGLAESKKGEAYDLARNTLSAEGKPRCSPTGADAPEIADRCAQVRAAASDADTFGNAGVGVFIGAGVLIAGATAFMLLRPDPETPPPPASDDGKPAAPTAKRAPPPSKRPAIQASRLVPVIGPEGGGLVWRGAF